jgi:acetolactate synthase-1/2/3 large subunit
MDDKLKVSDAVISELKNAGIDTVFGVTGGAVVHFFDSIEKMEGIQSLFFNHEQAASFAVESYAKARKSLGAGIFTTGPGATNALTGLAAAWLDSVPCVFISGQVRTNQTIAGRKLRQVGTQEIDILAMVKDLTKYAVTVYEPSEALYHIQKGLYLAQNGRPGPVWVDIPVDVSWTYLPKSEYKLFDPIDEQDLFNSPKPAPAPKLVVAEVANLLKSAKRPLVVAGNGLRLAGAESELLSLVEHYQIPTVATWAVCDWLPSSHPLHFGLPGLSGHRGANLAVQNSDLILAIGSHLNATIVGTRPEFFAREAQIVVVDIDANELEYCPVGIDVAVNTDAKSFLAEFSDQLRTSATFKPGQWSEWINRCNQYKSFNQIALDYTHSKQFVNSYYFNHVMSEMTSPGGIFVIDGGGSVVYAAFQSCRLKENQRLILSTGLCSMGSGIPEAIGVHCAQPEKQVYCLVGDGSFPFNMQELQTIKNHNMPIKIFVYNNDGYVSIRTTQQDFLEGRVVGSSPKSGLNLPDVKKVAEAFDLRYHLINRHEDVTTTLQKILKHTGPVLCEIIVAPDQEIVPRQGFAPRDDGTFDPRPIEDMYPFLDREKFKQLMIVSELDYSRENPLGREINLLKNYPQSRRPVELRSQQKRSRTASTSLDESGQMVSENLFEQMILERAKKFDKSYFDGGRDQGYGGYRYDKKYWRKVAQDIAGHYRLKSGDRVLEVGCAKGFLLHDLQQCVPGLIIQGLDISEYAISQAPATVRHDLVVGDAKALPFNDKSFDLVLAINTLSELAEADLVSALNEIGRVAKGRSFVTLNAWRNPRERNRLMKWNLTALTNKSVAGWKSMLKAIEYKGDYSWFFAN